MQQTGPGHTDEDSVPCGAGNASGGKRAPAGSTLITYVRTPQRSSLRNPQRLRAQQYQGVDRQSATAVTSCQAASARGAIRLRHCGGVRREGGHPTR